MLNCISLSPSIIRTSEDCIRTEKCLNLRSVQTVRIVKAYKPLSQITRGNILSVINEMQFTDRKVPFTICRDRTDRQTLQAPLSDKT